MQDIDMSLGYCASDFSVGKMDTCGSKMQKFSSVTDHMQPDDNNCKMTSFLQQNIFCNITNGIDTLNLNFNLQVSLIYFLLIIIPIVYLHSHNLWHFRYSSIIFLYYIILSLAVFKIVCLFFTCIYFKILHQLLNHEHYINCFNIIRTILMENSCGINEFCIWKFLFYA